MDIVFVGKNTNNLCNRQKNILKSEVNRTKLLLYFYCISQNFSKKKWIFRPLSAFDSEAKDVWIVG